MADESVRQADPYDRTLGGLDGLPDVVHTDNRTILTVVPLLGDAETWIVRSFRQREVGDTIFLQRISAAGGALRLVIPPKVSEAIARQRDQLTAKSRSKTGRAAFAGRSDEQRAAAAARLQRPEVRAKALKARKKKSAAKRARKQKGGGA